MPEDIPGYRVLEQVGQGGFSAVYRAHQERLDRVVALKVLNVGAVDDAAMRRFTRECRITGRLTGHPHVVTVLDTGMTRSGAPFIAMEYFERGSLTDRLAREGPLPVPDVLRVGVKIASALAAVHEADVLHRDVKPQNVLVSRYGEPALTDFGIALLTESLEGTHTTAFTPQHAAPEVLNGRTLRPTSDIYALGSTLYQLLAGGPAFHTEPGVGLAPLILRIVSEPPPAIPRGDLPASVFEAVRTAMAKDPDDRFPTAIAFAAHLRRLQADLGYPVTELPLSTTQPAAPAPQPPSGTPPPVTPPPAGPPSDGPHGGATLPAGRPDGGPARAGASAAGAFGATASPVEFGTQPSGSEDPTAPAGRSPLDDVPPRLSFPPPGTGLPPETVPGPAASPRPASSAPRPTPDAPRGPDAPSTSDAASGPPPSVVSGASAPPAVSGGSSPGAVAAPGAAPEPPGSDAKPPSPFPAAFPGPGPDVHPGPGAFAAPPMPGPPPAAPQHPSVADPRGAGPNLALGTGPRGGGASGGGPDVALGAGPRGGTPGALNGGPDGAADGGARKGRRVIWLATGLAVVATGVAVGLGGLLFARDGDDGAQPDEPGRARPTQPARPSGQATKPGVSPAQIKLARPRAVRAHAVNHGRAVVLRWRLSAAARKIPIFVHKAPGSRRPVPLKNGARTTTIGHLNPRLGYCFQVFTMVEPGNPPTLAKAKPVCVRGAVPR